MLRLSKIHTIGVIVLAALLASSGASIAADDVETEDQKTFYFLGAGFAKNLQQLDLSKEEANLVLRGIREELDGNAMELDGQVYNARLQAVVQERQSRRAEKEKAAAAEFLAAAAAVDGATQTESGLIYLTLDEGSGESPLATSTVRVHYHGTLRDGTVFDSSVERDAPAEFPLNRVIPCWTEGLQLMKMGGKSKLVCPSEIAYGERGSPPKIPGGAALTFEVELLEIK